MSPATVRTETFLDEGDDMEPQTLGTNTGGRVRFAKDAQVRILELDGTVTKTVYVIGNNPNSQDEQQRSDRKGFVSLREMDGTRVLRVHHRRVLPVSVEGKAIVLESGDKFWALCPECGQTISVGADTDSVECSKCSKSFQLYWLGVKPMADTATKTEKAHKAPKAEKAPKAPKAPREPRPIKEPVLVDISALTKLKHCELWTKKNVKFDHERIDVQAHVLLFNGDHPRKLCFNTYNGAMGKKAAPLPLEAFVAGTKGVKKEMPWFPVEDVAKARQKLQKSGYERH